MKKGKKRNHIVVLIFLFMLQVSWSQTVFGKWKTIDDRNGITKAIVEVYEENGLLQARILKILEKGKENALCIKCKGDLKDKPVTGMKIMDDYKRNNKGEYKGSRLFDPEQAMTFRGKVWLDPKDSNRLKVRGYLAFLYRTQTWHRVLDE
ncbi:DUF2147 domain-containing protein [Flagellimonas hymeniacidonis]|uniref:DUF2147 domain-containing protein n=1 Tax=Flagellimonas hymeniacidonis TaxID=2603628 RepID=A0A5C8V0V1_9FLAO|nr:DUF2147 domain-containing protein [Flagellimonas hymeniacidonis]TXN35403.1 DUF2147 domain-containing protein [Flagellimonas hymeniacidonis]